MHESDAEFAPEPIRQMFDSDQDHARAWLEWAERTPGGWRARLADKLALDDTPMTLPPAWATIVGLPGLVPDVSSQAHATSEDEWPEPVTTGGGLVRYIEQPSPCCDAPVVLDPEASWFRHGMCAGCGTVLRRTLARWDELPATGTDD